MRPGPRRAPLVIVLSALATAGCHEPPPAPPRETTASPASTASAVAAAPAARPTATVVSAAPRVVPDVEFTTGGAPASARLPLIVALHGFGDSPRGFAPVFAGFDGPARVVLPHSDEPVGDGYQWFPLRGVGAPEGAGPIGDMADAIVAFASDLARARPTAGKPIITGFSQGAALSYAVAARHPTEIAAALPLSGWLPRPLVPTSPVTGAAPVFAFHGDADARVPIALGRQARDDLSTAGVPVTWREFPGVQHAIPPVTRAALFDALTRLCAEQR